MVNCFFGISAFLSAGLAGSPYFSNSVFSLCFRRCSTDTASPQNAKRGSAVFVSRDLSACGHMLVSVATRAVGSICYYTARASPGQCAHTHISALHRKHRDLRQTVGLNIREYGTNIFQLRAFLETDMHYGFGVSGAIRTRGLIINLAGFVTERSVKGHTVQFALLVADDGDLVLVWINGLDIAADLMLKRGRPLSISFSYGFLFGSTTNTFMICPPWLLFLGIKKAAGVAALRLFVFDKPEFIYLFL